MEKELCRIFRINFPTIIRSDELVNDILSRQDNHVIEKRNEQGELIAAAVINKNTILMLCVNREYRNQGIGSELLQACEDYVAESGYEKVIFGVGFDYLMPGVPKVEDNESFLLKRGYYNSYGDEEAFDMAMDMKDCAADCNLGDVIDGVTYRLATEEDYDKVIACMRDAEPGFVEYYERKSLYGACETEFVLIAEKDSQVCGALLIEHETDAPETGSIGCVATGTKFRHQGIGTNMAKVGTRYNKDKGMKYGYLGYTHTGLDKMYGAAGYQITNRYMMAHKELISHPSLCIM